MTPRAVNQLSRALSKSIAHGGFLPETVLYMDGDLLLWWLPPDKRHIVFRAAELKERWGTTERGEAKVRQVVQQVIAAKPRGYLAILSHFQRLLKLDLDRRTARVESALPLAGRSRRPSRRTLRAATARG